MFERLEDYGSFTDVWCFVMKETCKTVRNTVKNNRRSVTSLNQRIGCIEPLTCKDVQNFKYFDTSFSAEESGKIIKDFLD